MVVACLVLTTISKAQQSVYEYDFDHLSVGQYNEQQLKNALVDIDFCNGADEGRVYISSVPGYGNALDVKFPKGGVKTGGSGINTKWFFNDNKVHEELYFSYSLFIPADFEWATGGKLPGLGYQTSNRNMSLRLMWRLDGLLEFYVHYNTTPTRPGYQASINWSLTNPYDANGGPGTDQVKLKKGQWNHIKMYYKLNTPGQADGIMRGWLNGKLAINVTDNPDMRTATEGDIKINCMYFSAFFGTSVPSPVNTYVYFDNLLVTTEDASNQNTAPSVAISSPTNNASYTAGTNITIQATATDDDGTVKRVEFYNNGTKIGTDYSQPFSYVISSASAGTYSLTAKAIDSDNLSTTSNPIKVTVKAEDNGGGTTCSFGTPSATSLPTFNEVTFTKLHVLGSGGPNLSTISKLRMNWDASTKSLKRFAFYTSDGNPSYYVDLRSKLTQNFGSTNPSITITGSPFGGLDGSYWVNKDGDNFVMVSKTGGFTLYFSNSSTTPSCVVQKSARMDKSQSSGSITMYPNPLRGNILNINGLDGISSEVVVTDMQGRQILKTVLGGTAKQLDVSSIKSGVYIISIVNAAGSTAHLFNKL